MCCVIIVFDDLIIVVVEIDSVVNVMIFYFKFGYIGIFEDIVYVKVFNEYFGIKFVWCLLLSVLEFEVVVIIEIVS